MKPSSRRHFLKGISGGLAGAFVLTARAESPKSLLRLLSEQDVPPGSEEFWKLVRSQFPLTHDRIYLNNGTIGPSPYAVLDAVRHSTEDLDIRGEYDGWETARPKLAKFLNVDVSEISLTHNATEGINIVAGGLPLKRGDEVIMTTHEHAGNALPWLNRLHLDGITIRTMKPAATAAENLNRINDLITGRTRAIAVPHITCTVGQVMPAGEITKLGHDKGLWVFFDGAHGPGMMPLDLKGLGCDFYAACGHKWMCGPRGTGFLYVRKEMLDVLTPRAIGAYSDAGWDLTTDPPEFKGYVPTAHRFDYGTQSAPISIGFAAAADFLSQIGMERIADRNTSLARQLQEGLLALGGKIEMLTPTEEKSRAAIIGFRLVNIPYDKFGEHASRRGFRIRLVPESHLNSVRVSTHLYNSPEEVAKFLDAVKEVA